MLSQDYYAAKYHYYKNLLQNMQRIEMGTHCKHVVIRDYTHPTSKSPYSEHSTTSSIGKKLLPYAQKYEKIKKSQKNLETYLSIIAKSLSKSKSSQWFTMFSLSRLKKYLNHVQTISK